MERFPDSASGVKSFQIGGHQVGGEATPFIIAEIAQAHDGSLGTAHAYIDLAKSCGVQAVKFQTHIADAESTPGEPFRVPFSRQDPDRYSYWKRMEFTSEQWVELKVHCDEVGLVFLSSPFSLPAITLLDTIGMPAWKIPSGALTHRPLIEATARTGAPVLLSTGMASDAEIDEAADWVRSSGAPLATFQCTSVYPCPPEKVGLNQIEQLRARLKCPVGLSDHSGDIYAGLAAATLGASLIEVHLVFSRDCFGPDVSSSLLPDQMRALTEGAAKIHRMRTHPLNKDASAEALEGMKEIFESSIYLQCDVAAGQVIQESDLAFKKPPVGVPAKDWRDVIGKTPRNPMSAGDPLKWEDLV